MHKAKYIFLIISEVFRATNNCLSTFLPFTGSRYNLEEVEKGEVGTVPSLAPPLEVKEKGEYIIWSSSL